MLARKLLAIAGLTLALSTLGSAVAFAAKPGETSSSSISLVLLSGASPTTLTNPTYGDLVTFNVTTAATAYPYVNLNCYQNGVLVAEGWAGFFDGALGDRTFALYSPQWTAGAADCTAYLAMNWHGKWKHLAWTSFHVDP